MDFELDDDEEFLKILQEINDKENDAKTSVEPEPNAEHIKCLQNCFGHNEFRPLQWKVIRSIIEDKRDNCCIMATGYGKSLCFQFPPVFANGISFIISPLISLMQDQVNSLNLVNIPACLLGSAQTNKAIVEDIIRGDFRIVYASPEYVSSMGSYLIGKLKDKLTLIAVDEAHCISSWGNDFRPKYLELANIRNDAPNVPILAVTATATDRVQKDICSHLKLRNPQIICTGFDRPNLEIVVRRKTKEPWDDIQLILRSKLLVNASCIIYCLTRKATDSICEVLQGHGLKCGAYHAGKTQKQRKEVFDKFIRDEINIIVATVAFGMGIDKSDVRCVIHYGAPPDMDSYYQEIGRAGRDGVQSKCVLFYSEVDFETHRHLRINSRLSDVEMRKSESRAKIMSDFIYTKECRRLKILQYFDGPSVKSPKLDVCCDNCRNASNSSDGQNKLEEIDFTKDAKIMLDAISLFNGNSGLTKPIAVLRGSKLKTIERFHNHKLMGCGLYKSEQYWKLLADILERKDFLERQSLKNDGFVGSTIKISRQGQQWLTSNKPLKLVPPEQMIHLIKSEKTVNIPAATTSSSIKPLYSTSSTSHGTLAVNQTLNKTDEELKRNLMMVRAMIASREGTMPYKIASEPAIDRLVTMKPLNLQELKDAKVEGFSEALIKQFGMEFLKCIQRSKGLLPQISMENMDEKSHCSDVKEVHGVVSTSSNNGISSTNLNIPQITPEMKNTPSEYQNAFDDDDDDDLFMMVDYENSKGTSEVNKLATSKEVTKGLVAIAPTESKRIKYEDSSSSDNSSTKNDKCISKTSIPPKPIGIRKRNIF